MKHEYFKVSPVLASNVLDTDTCQTHIEHTEVVLNFKKLKKWC